LIPRVRLRQLLLGTDGPADVVAAGAAAPGIGDPDAPARPAAPRSIRSQLAAWLTIGTQSFGGGSATLYLMRRVLIDQRRWMTEQEFVEDWALSRVSPGVSAIALTALLGRRVGGRRGVVLAIGGMLVPAAGITAILTALFGLVADQPVVAAALAGMGPATIGMMLGMTIFMARSVVRRDRRATADLGLAGAALVIGFVAPTNPVVVLLGGAAVGSFLLGQRSEPEMAASP
jgi:chromate transporter